MAIHGSKTQGERDFVMDEFRKGKISIMIATDVAARGIGIPFAFDLLLFLLVCLVVVVWLFAFSIRP